MKSPTISIIFDRKHQSSASTTGVVEIRVTFERQQKYYSTGVKVLPSQWDKERHVIKHPDSDLLNSKVDSLHNSIKKFITECNFDNKAFSFSGLNGAIDKSRIDGSFWKFVEKSRESKTELTESTRNNHKKLSNIMEDLQMFERFSDITTDNIMTFDRKLHERNYAQPTVHTYHKFLKIYVREALQKKLIESDPYVGIKIDRGKPADRKYLTTEELDKIKGCEIFSDCINRTRDLFLFQSYTGMAYAEIERFDAENITKREGRFVYIAQRKKTHESFYTIIIPKAMEILKKYDMKLPVISNQKYNLQLKTLASIAEIKRDLTSHMARHTFAVSAINAGIPMEVISKMLGHTNTNTTQIYAKVINKTIEDAFGKLEKIL